MARAEVIHSTDAVLVKFRGNPRRPEPSTAVIEFPGGHVEVSRCSDGTYWAHTYVVDAANVVDSRADFAHGAHRPVTDIPDGELLRKVAIRIANRVPHFDPDGAS